MPVAQRRRHLRLMQAWLALNGCLACPTHACAAHVAGCTQLTSVKDVFADGCVPEKLLKEAMSKSGPGPAFLPVNISAGWRLGLSASDSPIRSGGVQAGFKEWIDKVRAIDNIHPIKPVLQLWLTTA